MSTEKKIQLGIPGIGKDKEVSDISIGAADRLRKLVDAVDDPEELAEAFEAMDYVELCGLGEAFGRLSTIVSKLITERASSGGVL